MEFNERMILIVDDHEETAALHAQILQKLGYQVLVQTNSELVEQQFDQNPQIDLVLLDMRMPKIDGLEILHRLKLRKPELGVVIATVVNDIEKAVKATKAGAYNYLLKPIQIERLAQVLSSFFDNRPLSFFNDPRFTPFITQNEIFEEIFRRIQSFAEADIPILIQGETGTGKELIAQIIHSLSPRSREKFVPINLAALSPQLFESELFGHRRGSFTGAIRDHDGYFQAVGQGTLFLDEIGELQEDQQKKLLRVLQTKRYCRIGETVERETQARFIFATNRDLRAAAEVGQFRPDLYYRLASCLVSLPALREREGDVEILANYFLKKYCSQFGRAIQGFEQKALELLSQYSFPGNVRELEGMISGAVLIEQSHLVQASSLPEYIRAVESKLESFQSFRYKKILTALAETNGNQTKAAERLGIARGTLNRLLKEYRERGLYV